MDEAGGLYQYLSDGETFSATALVGYVRVLELKRGTQTLGSEIDDGAIQKGQAIGGYNDFYIILFKNHVAGLNIFRQLNRVSPTGTAGFPYAQP